MKQSKHAFIGLLGVILVLIAYSIFTAKRASNLEKRVKLLEESQARQRAIANTILRTDASSPAATARALQLLGESLGLPPPTIVEHRPTVTEVNAIPLVAKSK